MTILDTNILLRHFIQDDAQRAARYIALLASVARGDLQAWTNDLVVVETGLCVRLQTQEWVWLDASADPGGPTPPADAVAPTDSQQVLLPLHLWSLYPARH